MSPSLGAIPASRGRAWVGCGIFLVTLAVFSPALGNDFVMMDDPEYVTANPHVQEGVSGNTIAWALTTSSAGNWHPLTWLSHALDWQLWGRRAAGHHLTSILLHALNALLLFWFLSRTTGPGLGRSAFVALLFALHPLRVESVAWVSERKDVLSGSLALACLLFYAAYASKPTRAGYGLVVLTFILGLLSKSMLVTLPAVMVLMDVWPLRRAPGFAAPGVLVATWTRILVEKVPLVLCVLASSLVTLLAQRKARATFHPEHLGWILERVILSYWRYVGKLFWPTELSGLYPLSYLHRPLLLVVLAGAVLGLSVPFALWLLKKRAPVGVGWLWFLGMLVPVVGIVRVGWLAIAERYTYLPSIGLCIALVYGFPELAFSRTVRNAVSVFGAGAVVLLAALTVRRIPAWRDSESLFASALAVEPDNPAAQFRLGLVRLDQRRLPEAEALFRAAVTSWPWLNLSRAKLGETLGREGKLPEALVVLTEANRLQPHVDNTEFALAKTQLALGDWASAEQNLRAVEERNPDSLALHLELARLLEKHGSVEGAITEMERAVRLSPENGALYSRLGLLLLRSGRAQRAEAALKEALRLNPEDEQAQRTLGALPAPKPTVPVQRR